MSLAAWLGFLLAAIVIAVTPGPGAVISMSTGMRHGYRAALVAILGLQTALLAHVAVVAVGLGTLLAASETAFSLLKLIGAGYLVWLGLQKWRAPPTPIDDKCPEPQRNGLFMQGLLVNLSNPKAIIFICALVPQFIDPSKAQFPQYLVIATTLCATDIVVMSTYALAAARLGNWLHRAEYVRLQNRIFGSLFVSAGALLGVSLRN